MPSQQTRRLVVAKPGNAGQYDQIRIHLTDSNGTVLSVIGVNKPELRKKDIYFGRVAKPGNAEFYQDSFIAAVLPGGHGKELMRKANRIFEKLAFVYGKPVVNSIHCERPAVRRLLHEYSFEGEEGLKTFEPKNHELTPDEEQVLHFLRTHVDGQNRKSFWQKFLFRK